MADLTRADFEAAVARGDALMRSPRAERAHFDAGRNRIIVRLTTGVEVEPARSRPKVVASRKNGRKRGRSLKPDAA